MTHEVPKVGAVVWIAEPIFDHEPTADEVREIDGWRWPVLFPLKAALRRRLVTAIGDVPLPAELRNFPVMRSGNKKMGWMAFAEVDGVRRRLGSAEDASIPIYQVVNDTALKEMIVTGWKPEDVW